MGAEVVVETGGIFNRLGSLQVGVMAKAFNVPVYIAAGRIDDVLLVDREL